MNLKLFLKKEIFETIKKIEFVRSGSLVGSFVDKKNLEGIGDIDTIIIVDKLTEKK